MSIDLEKVLTKGQKEDVITSAIVRASEQDLVKEHFTVTYDRRYSHIFEAKRVNQPSGTPVEIIFSISPIHAPKAFFQNAAYEASRAVRDILDRTVAATVKPRPSELDVECPCCSERIHIVTTRSHREVLP